MDPRTGTPNPASSVRIWSGKTMLAPDPIEFDRLRCADEMATKTMDSVVFGGEADPGVRKRRRHRSRSLRRRRHGSGSRDPEARRGGDDAESRGSEAEAAGSRGSGQQRRIWSEEDLVSRGGSDIPIVSSGDDADPTERWPADAESGHEMTSR